MTVPSFIRSPVDGVSSIYKYSPKAYGKGPLSNELGVNCAIPNRFLQLNPYQRVWAFPLYHVLTNGWYGLTSSWPTCLVLWQHHTLLITIALESQLFISNRTNLTPPPHILHYSSWVSSLFGSFTFIVKNLKSSHQIPWLTVLVFWLELHQIYRSILEQLIYLWYLLSILKIWLSPLFTCFLYIFK